MSVAYKALKRKALYRERVGTSGSFPRSAGARRLARGFRARAPPPPRKAREEGENRRRCFSDEPAGRLKGAGTAPPRADASFLGPPCGEPRKIRVRPMSVGQDVLFEEVIRAACPARNEEVRNQTEAAILERMGGGPVQAKEIAKFSKAEADAFITVGAEVKFSYGT